MERRTRGAGPRAGIARLYLFGGRLCGRILDACLFSQSAEFHRTARSGHARAGNELWPGVAVGEYFARRGKRFAGRSLLFYGRLVSRGRPFGVRFAGRSSCFSSNLFTLDLRSARWVGRGAGVCYRDQSSASARRHSLAGNDRSAHALAARGKRIGRSADAGQSPAQRSAWHDCVNHDYSGEPKPAATGASTAVG